jgi:hypothetical protein
MNRMKITDVGDPQFRKYGRVVKGYDCSELIKKMQETPLPENVIYVPAEPELEALEVFDELQNRAFGGLPIQLGYCNGSNVLLNAVEYHRSSEINVAATDLILLVGCQQDMDPDRYTYDTSLIEAFFVPAGTVIEVYATTLHYAPCSANKAGFRCVVILPRGTNQPLETKQEAFEDRLLFAKNKWLAAHPETDLGQQGAFVGLVGDNISVEEFI